MQFTPPQLGILSGPGGSIIAFPLNDPVFHLSRPDVRLCHQKRLATFMELRIAIKNYHTHNICFIGNNIKTNKSETIFACVLGVLVSRSDNRLELVG